VASRHPLWESRLDDDRIVSSLDRGMLLDTGKEALATTALDAAPDMILEMPKDSFAPVLLAGGLAILFVGLLLKVWIGVAVGAAVVVVALVNWMWPRIDLRERKPAHG
jgi:cytochrome c oxidase subunit 1/cytochrome c oxidase subunit I+III